MNQPIGKLAAAMLIVRDLSRSIRFYTETLGCTLQSQNETFAYLDAGDFLLTLNGNHNAPAPVVSHFFIFRVDNIDKAFDTLKAKGIEFMMPVVAFFDDQFGASFTDPDGHPLTIMGPRIN